MGTGSGASAGVEEDESEDEDDDIMPSIARSDGTGATPAGSAVRESEGTVTLGNLGDPSHR
jgi:hypothetical protein